MTKNLSEADIERRQREIETARQAQDLLNNPVFLAAIAATREAYLKSWLESPPEAQILRERTHIAVQVLDEVVKHITIAVSSGKVVSSQLLRMQTGRA